tara:strand:- start:61625 stop:62587 length:963 start_codon:yes stop_codon:yes gene_type:complete
LTTIDTISISTSVDYIKDIDFNKFRISTTNNPNGLKIVNHSLLEKKIGLDSISINETFGTIKIKASSKILGSDYEKGVSLNTIDRFVDEINKSGIKLDQDYIADCELYRVDIKNDLTLKKEVKYYINAMSHLIAPKFNKTLYKSGISFNESIIKNPIRFTGYNKGIELLETKNKSFLKQYPTLINEFQNVLRLESRLLRKGTIKKYFGSYSLMDILNHKGLNFEVFNKIVDNQTNFKSIYNTLGMTNTEEKNFAQIYLLNDEYNGDFNSILNHIKGKLGSKTKATYQRNQIKKYLAIIKNSNNNETQANLIEIINSLKED